jgi:hypothetical protein
VTEGGVELDNDEYGDSARPSREHLDQIARPLRTDPKGGNSTWVPVERDHT